MKKMSSTLIISIGTSNTGKTYNSRLFLLARLGLIKIPQIDKQSIMKKDGDLYKFYKYIVLFDPHNYYGNIYGLPYEYNVFSGEYPISSFDDTEKFAQLLVEKNGSNFALNDAIIVIDELDYFDESEKRKIKIAITGRRHRDLEILINCWRPVTIPRTIFAGLKRGQFYKLVDNRDAEMIAKIIPADTEKCQNLPLQQGKFIAYYVGDHPFFDDEK